MGTIKLQYNIIFDDTVNTVAPCILIQFTLFLPTYALVYQLILMLIH